MGKSQKQVSNLVCRGKGTLRQQVEKEGIFSAE